MPFTPFHWGPALVLGLVFSFLDLPALLVSSVVLDVEAFTVMFLGFPGPLHGFFHSFFGGSLVAVLVAGVLWVGRKQVEYIMKSTGLEYEFSFKKAVLASFLGVYIHILLDSFLYTDIQPFWPLDWNPFPGLFSSFQVYGFCSICFLLGLVLYLGRERF